MEKSSILLPPTLFHIFHILKSAELGSTSLINCELSLILPEARPYVFGLISWIYRLSWGERLLEAEIQGRQDDAEEEALFEYADKSPKSKVEGKWQL